MTLTLLSLALLGATPAPSLLVVPATPGSRAFCEELLETFVAEKSKVKLAGERAAAVACTTRKNANERTACLVDSLNEANVDGIVLINGTVRGGKVVATMQLLSRTGDRERQETVRGVRKRFVTLAAPAVKRLVATLKAVVMIEENHADDDRSAREAPAPLPPPDAPVAVEVQLTRAPPPLATPAVTAAPPPPKTHGAAWVVSGVALVSAATAATFAGLGFSGKSRLEHVAFGISQLSYSQATALQRNANFELTVALGAGIAAAVATLVATLLWAQ